MYPSFNYDQYPILSNNRSLLIKFYLEYRHSYNPLARLTSAFEKQIININQLNDYQSFSSNKYSSNHEKRIDRINELYHSGSFH